MPYVSTISDSRAGRARPSITQRVLKLSNGLVDYRLGLILGVTMFVSAMVGARLAFKVGDEWLSRIFLTAVWLLGVKVLFCDFLAYRTGCNEATNASG